MRLLYTLLSYLAQPLVLLLMWKKGFHLPPYRSRLFERYAIYRGITAPAPNGIVVHAASVGEVIAATPLIKQILRQYPDLAVTVTTVTPTGSARVQAAFGEKVCHVYLPYDLPYAIQRFLNFIRPKLLIVIETELWPNLIHYANQRHIPFVIANARLSPRSAKRYGWIKPCIQDMLNSISLIAAQDSVSAARYLSLGVAPEKLVNTGNLKFDLEITPYLQEKIRTVAEKLALQHRLVWVAGSTHEGEEKCLLEVHKRLLKHYPNLLLILVPRHPERFNEVEGLLQKSGLTYLKRTDNLPLKASTSVLLGNTMGEMLIFYGLAHIAFVGGSLVKHGGHNPLEPIAFELPVISGVYTFNFPEIFAKLRQVGGVVEVENHLQALEEALTQLLNSPTLRAQISQAGFKILQANQGALKRHMKLLAPYLEK